MFLLQDSLTYPKILPAIVKFAMIKFKDSKNIFFPSNCFTQCFLRTSQSVSAQYFKEKLQLWIL